MSGRKKLLAPENDFTKHTCATSIVKFTTTPKKTSSVHFYGFTVSSKKLKFCITKARYILKSVSKVLKPTNVLPKKLH